MTVHPASKKAKDMTNWYMKGGPQELLEQAYKKVYESELEVWDLHQEIKEVEQERRENYQLAMDRGATYRSLSELTHQMAKDLGPARLGPDYEKIAVSFQRIDQRMRGK
jgi:hypothetical protein